MSSPVDRGILLGALVVFLSACPSPSTSAYVAALERMAEISEQTEGDCAAMGRALKRHFENEGEVIRLYQDHAHRLSRSEQTELESERYAPRIRATMQKLIPRFERCVDHETVREAFQRL